MKFTLPVAEGQFLKRYKRFFADIEKSGETLTAHVPNTGSLKGCLIDHAPCRYTISDDPKRKLKYTLQMIKTPSTWVGVNTGLSNDIVWEAWQKERVPHWQNYPCARREVKIHDKTRFDLVLWKNENVADPKKKVDPALFHQKSGPKFHFVEIKNVTLALDGVAQFPDAVTTRGQKHIRELVELIEKGHTAELVFVIQRTDCTSFSPADDIDPEYGCLLRESIEKGLKVSPYSCMLNADSVELDTKMPLPVNL